ncbi:MAG TPA: MFS transporter [Mycobacteriales bacterium]|nr:MFS transporter [Mycobacteriales bacterium]
MTVHPLKRLLADVTPLRNRDYRRLWAGQTVSFFGTQMTNVALPVEVYRLTHSSFDVGLLGLFTLIPLVAVGFFGGAITDAVDRRTLVLITSTVLAAVSAVLVWQAWAGWHAVWLLYLATACYGGVSALDGPARATFIPRLLSNELIPAASALSQLAMNLALSGGPLLAGVLIAASGLRAAFLVDLVSFAFALYGVFRLPSMKPEGGTTRPSLAAVGEGIQWLRHQPVVLMSFFVDIDAMLFGMPRALFPALAIHRFHGGDGITGLLYAAPAIGAFLMGVVSGPLGRVRKQGRAVIIAIAVWGATITAFGFSKDLVLAVVFLAMAGAADMVSAVYRSTIMQVATPDVMRGRLQGVFFAVVAGGARLGDVEAGGAAAIVGTDAAAWSGGILCLVGLAALAAAFPVFARYDAGTVAASPAAEELADEASSPG